LRADLVAGVILLALGACRFGGLIHLVPFPVTTGFTLGIACVIAVGQVPDQLGVPDHDLDAHPIRRLVGLADRIGALRAGDLTLGALTVVLLVIGRRLPRRLPVPLLTLALIALLGALLARFVPGLRVRDARRTIPVGRRGGRTRPRHPADGADVRMAMGRAGRRRQADRHRPERERVVAVTHQRRLGEPTGAVVEVEPVLLVRVVPHARSGSPAL
jgi:hypothetical protein